MPRITEILRTGPLIILAISLPVSVSVGGIATGLVLLTALGLLIFRRSEIQLPPLPVMAALFILIGFYFLATMMASPFPHNWFKFFEEMWIKLLLIAVPILLTGRPEMTVKVVKLLLVIGLLAAVYGVWQHFSEFDPIRQRSLVRAQWGHAAVTGFFSHHLSFAGQILVYLLLVLSWFMAGKNGRIRYWLPAALLVLGAALFWTFSRSAILGVAAGIVALIILVRGWRRWVGLAALVTGTAVSLLIPSIRTHMLMLFEMKRHVTRLNLWKSSWDGIQARPWLGFGPGNFESLLAGHQVQGYYETLAHSHNDLLMHGVNAGIPAILAAVALLVVTCRLFWMAWKRAVLGRWVILGAMGVQVGITVAGFFQVYQTDDEVEMLLYFILGCAVALAGSPDQSDKSDQSAI